MALALTVALALDRVFGEPPPRWHPVVWMGHYLGAVGPRLCRWQPAAAFLGGLVAWCLGALLVTGMAAALQAGLHQLLGTGLSAGVASGLAVGIALKPMLAWRMLFDEVRAVEQAFERGLPAARARLARIVSRDTTSLSPQQVREAALETLAENLNDSVVAPLMWFVLAGLPGAALYRYANTADAMWGYRGRWEWAGKAAARIDDVMSWLPARVTALLLLGPHQRLWRRLGAVARRTPSPNGGWPMGALALRLGVCLRKPQVYVLNEHGRQVEPTDTARALAWAAQAGLAAAALALALCLVRWRT
ncbi:adenosylcobinamide-phosphate synthase CbiB [Ideonella sp. BN130291]|uniref:adenosylcobinamide-phosphate synthase CbiB n=1 Tax=Ideonella sp. BN130291 TaxID=3112940 RepID=UPI002E2656AD|nr:adenosylcobinamide-phosphate synthase CbiB [Ideonella sp. BN130291]